MCSVTIWSSVPYSVKGQCQMHIQNISGTPLEVSLPSKFGIRPALLNCAWGFAQKTKIVCLLVSVSIRNAFLLWREQDLCQQNVLLMKQHSMCQQVKCNILGSENCDNVLNMMCYLLMVNMWYAVMKNINSPFYLEEHLVAGNKFLVIIEETALRHIPAGTVFKLGGAPSHFSHCVHAFLSTEFPDHWKGRRSQIPWLLSSPHVILLNFTLLEVCKRHRSKMCHQYVVSLMVSILRSTEYIRNLVRCSLWRRINFSLTLPDESYMIFYFIDI